MSAYTAYLISMAMLALVALTVLALGFDWRAR
jgi:hypothetical protein